LSISTIVLLFDRQWPQNVHSFESPFLLKIDSFWRSFNKLEQLAFCREIIKDLAQFFDYRTATLPNVVICHHGNINHCDPPLITREWLEENIQLVNFAYMASIEPFTYGSNLKHFFCLYVLQREIL
jgi:hypothetical protein